MLARLRCLVCGGGIELESLEQAPGYPELGPDGRLRCDACGEQYPLIGGTARMVQGVARRRLVEAYPRSAGVVDGAADRTTGFAEEAVRQRTAESFAYEWRHFGRPREEWGKNFLDYLQPHGPAFLAGRIVLDVGAGSGRHSAQAARHGAAVIAVDLGRSIDTARRNLPTSVLTVQADAQRLPFEPHTFDLVMSIGVLHHLPDPEAALRAIARYARPGGHVHVYLYWIPEHPVHRRVLAAVRAARVLTVRIPHRLLHALCYPLALLLWVAIVLPYRAVRARPRTRDWADAFPLKTYADYPFAVLVNDQFDRFSAPLENRYTRPQVDAMLRDAGLEQVQVLSNHGWVGDGVVPATSV